ncbi:glycoside hydrolase family 3 C-terminal domain-containing protein [Nocardia rhamnosiphila]|uniref:Glycoside hydrolase family 3 C-terminal domain-containing protein n=1 Tax=Nocardia rhamnosiphila TaxID=426716 RepID=A0ABV2WRH6_9NOCA
MSRASNTSEIDAFATRVDNPEDADVAHVRKAAPDCSDHARGFLGSMHKGSLEFEDAEITRLAELTSIVSTVLDVYLARPAVLTGLESVAALIGSFGTDDAPLLEVIFGDAEPEGRLPFDLPPTMAAVIASRTDVPFYTQAPLFSFGFGLRYQR